MDEIIKAALKLIESMRMVDFYHSYEAQVLYQALKDFGFNPDISGGAWSEDEFIAYESKIKYF